MRDFMPLIRNCSCHQYSWMHVLACTFTLLFLCVPLSETAFGCGCGVGTPLQGILWVGGALPVVPCPLVTSVGLCGLGWPRLGLRLSCS